MRIIVLGGYGLNCEEETLFAFLEAGRYLNAAVVGEIVHVNELMLNPGRLKQCNVLVIPGGFAYGDDTGAGNALAVRLRHLGEEIREFLTYDKLVMGICNGCQVLLRLGFSNITLTHNDIGRYQCRWTRTKVCGDSVWLRGIQELYIPVAHGEGKFYAKDGVIQELEERGSVVLRYVRDDGSSAGGVFPYNPNGSLQDIAALSGNEGRALFIMPHPERAIFFTQRYDWTDIKDQALRAGRPIENYADGFKIFCNAVQYFC